MLVLTRRIDQGVRIGDCRVVVLGVERDRVKLGFDAPLGTSILRDELAETNQQLLDEITERVGIETPRNVEVVRRALNKASPPASGPRGRTAEAGVKQPLATVRGLNNPGTARAE